MRTETNTKLVTRNRRFAQYLFFFSLAVLIGAFVFTNQQALSATPASPDSLEGTLLLLLPAIVLPVGVIASMVSVRMTNTWIRQPRPENALRDGLKGLSNKSVLYNYYHMPARHVLICPQGVFAVVTRFQDGHYKVDGDKWQTFGGAFNTFLRFFRRDGIGNPNEEAQRAAAHVQSLIDPIAPGVRVQPVIVFIDPRATVEINDPAIPVLFPDAKHEHSITNYLRDIPKDQRQSLTPNQIQEFENATLNQ
ncbi:MAG: hypothetical protein CL610_10000 [Anaerolineaceae bacterium]|nr:hypothetical protein [Anaerolineaceae bacterium]